VLIMAALARHPTRRRRKVRRGAWVFQVRSKCGAGLAKSERIADQGAILLCFIVFSLAVGLSQDMLSGGISCKLCLAWSKEGRLAREARRVKGATMRQIADWLDKLGLGQYARRFDENGIDPTVLSDLTNQDLEKLGVLLAAAS
jgi:SAM domain (Sterile alpha motif)